MKKYLSLLILTVVLGAIPCFAAGYGGMYGGGGMRTWGMQGGMYGGRNNNFGRPSRNYTYYYRPVDPVPPNYDKSGVRTQPQTISCLGTSSYRTIGGGNYACNSAAATRVKVKYKNDKVSTTYNKKFGM